MPSPGAPTETSGGGEHSSSAPGSPSLADSPAAESPLALSNLAGARAASGDLAGAEEALRQALQQSPGSPPVLAELARVLLAAGRAAEAVDPAVRAADLGGRADGRTYLLAVSTRLRAGQAGEAEADLARWERRDGISPMLHVSRGLLREEEGRAREAEAEYGAALEADPRCQEALSGLVKLRFDRGDASGALGAVRGARVGGVAPRLWESQALQRLGRLEEAEAPLRAALGAEPDHPAALAELGSLRARRGDYAEARRLLARALSLDPGLTSARANLEEVDRRIARP